VNARAASLPSTDSPTDSAVVAAVLTGLGGGLAATIHCINNALSLNRMLPLAAVVLGLAGLRQRRTATHLPDNVARSRQCGAARIGLWYQPAGSMIVEMSPSLQQLLGLAASRISENDVLVAHVIDSQ
jgi:hypothetical protein